MLNVLVNKAKVIKIDAENLFTKVKRQDVLDMFQNTAINKLTVISKALQNYNDFIHKRKETIETDQIMERFEHLEPMISNIYNKCGNKIEEEHWK